MNHDTCWISFIVIDSSMTHDELRLCVPPVQDAVCFTEHQIHRLVMQQNSFPVTGQQSCLLWKTRVSSPSSGFSNVASTFTLFLCLSREQQVWNVSGVQPAARWGRLHSVRGGPLNILVDWLPWYFQCYIMKRILPERDVHLSKASLLPNTLQTFYHSDYSRCQHLRWGASLESARGGLMALRTLVAVIFLEHSSPN